MQQLNTPSTAKNTLRLCETHLEGFTLKRNFWQNMQTDQNLTLMKYTLNDALAQDAIRS